MLKLDINIPFSFPVYRLNEEVEYSEVTKPSGISYILLVLINESNDRSKTLHDLLLEIGVPERLHHIFKKELIDLIDNKKILSSVASSSVIDGQFERIQISYLSFTENGEKIFKNEKIVTGNKKLVRTYVYYNIAFNEFCLGLAPELDAKKMSKSPIEVLPFDDLTIKKNVEDYLNINKGQQWSSSNGKFSIKKDEVILNVTELDKDIFTCKYVGNLKNDGDNITINFEEVLLTKFINNYYNGEIINNLIAANNKFKFSNEVSNNLSLSKCLDNSDIYIPEKLKEILKQKNLLFISKGVYKPSNDSSITFPELGNNYDFITIDKNENINAYELGVFNFMNEKFGVIKIPLIVKSKLSRDLFKDLIKPFVLSNKEYDFNSYKQLLKITNFSKDYDLLMTLTKSYVSDNLIENINRFNEIASINIKDNDFKDSIIKMLDTNVRQYIDKIDDTSINDLLKILKNISNNIKFDDKEILDLVKDKINNDKLINYELFVNNNFDRSLVLMYYNPVEEALKSNRINDPRLKEFVNYYNLIENLKKITGIKNVLNFSYDCEDIDDKAFINDFHSIHTLKNKVDLFRFGNEELFKQLDDFYHIFDLIHEDVNMMVNARRNPQSITLDYIKQQILKSNYQFAFVNLSSKLGNYLTSKYKFTGKLYDKLKAAKSNKIISKKIYDDLNTFRDYRNDMVHADIFGLKFSESDLNRWAEEIFEIIGDDNSESKSSN